MDRPPMPVPITIASGFLESYRDCHVRPGLVLIYRLPDPDTLQLVRLGSHSELFG